MNLKLATVLSIFTLLFANSTFAEEESPLLANQIEVNVSSDLHDHYADFAPPSVPLQLMAKPFSIARFMIVAGLARVSGALKVSDAKLLQDKGRIVIERGATAPVVVCQYIVSGGQSISAELSAIMNRQVELDADFEWLAKVLPELENIVDIDECN